MNNKPTPHLISVLTLGDVYYTLFRHKRLILGCCALGVIAALIVPFIKPEPYRSAAKILVRYIHAKPVDSRVKSPDERGEFIMNSEMEILTSFDLAQQAADVVGPGNILGKKEYRMEREQAARFVQQNLVVEAAKNSSVIRLHFRHPDSKVAQAVLRELLMAYFNKHIEVHGAFGMVDNFLTERTIRLRSRLVQMDHDLRVARSKVGTISQDESKGAHIGMMGKLRERLSSAETELKQRQVALNAIVISQVTPSRPSGASGTESAPGLGEYKSVIVRLDLLWKKEQELLMDFTQENARVRGVREQIAEARKLKNTLEMDYPNLTSQGIHQNFDLPGETARVASLESEIKFLNTQVGRMENETVVPDRRNISTAEQQRKTLSDESISNISLIQLPSPASRNGMATLMKMGLVLMASAIGGIVLAFLMDLVFDRSIKRPVEIKIMLGVDSLLSIPHMNCNGHASFASNGENGSWSNGNGRTDTVHASGHCGGRLRPFHDALRDRLAVYFRARDIRHKPKLIGVTNVSKNAGASATAMGLAASLSETGEGNVLLIDMHPEHEATQHFSRDKPICELQSALAICDRTLLKTNRYVVTRALRGNELTRTLPSRFIKMVPQLEASDYDYIIFDMPSVSQTSVTPRLAGFMDMVILVVEAEKTDREVVRQANALCTESKASVRVILNKTRNPVPARLYQDLLNEA